jgi:hypothetical protein
VTGHDPASLKGFCRYPVAQSPQPSGSRKGRFRGRCATDLSHERTVTHDRRKLPKLRHYALVAGLLTRRQTPGRCSAAGVNLVVSAARVASVSSGGACA